MTTHPLGWSLARLSEIAEINPPNPEVNPAGSTEVSFVPMTAVQALTGRMDPSQLRHWSDVQKGYTRFQNDDVLFAKITPCMENGKIAVARGLRSGVGAGSTEFHVLRSSAAIFPSYLMYHLLQETFRKRARAAMKGTSGHLRVPASVLEEYLIPVAPSAEQMRILGVIDSHVTRLDETSALLERVQRNLKRYQASVLKAAVEGRLVPTEAELARAEKRDYEPASALLKRILTERRERWEKDGRRGKYGEPEQPNTAQLPHLPLGWCWSTLDQVVLSLEGGTATTATSARTARPVLRSSAVRQGYVDLNDVRYLPATAPSKEGAFIEEGDLLFTRLSGTLEYVGNCAHVPYLSGKRIEFPDRIFRARCGLLICRSFVQLCFGEKSLRLLLEKAAKSTAGHQRISLGDLRSFALPLPPLAEQVRIAAEVDVRLSVIRALDASVEANRKRSARLRQSILKWAFEGKLVDQDPNDEPASALLARIKGETPTTAPKKTAGPRRAKKTA
jgi:type I restriction enzyme S subunit